MTFDDLDSQGRAADVATADWTEAKRRLKDEDTPFNRRNVYRTGVTTIETFAYLLSALAGNLLTNRIQVFGPSPELALKLAVAWSKDVTVSTSGRATVVDRKISSPRLMAFVVREVSDVVGLKPRWLSGHKWEAFGKAHKIRNRITHPRSEQDLVVSDNDLTILGDAVQWVSETWKELLVVSREDNVH